MRDEVWDWVLQWALQCAIWHATLNFSVATDIGHDWPTAQLRRTNWSRYQEHMHFVRHFDDIDM